MLDLKDRLLGGLYGLLIGDAVGMPYEFKRPINIPLMHEIDMEPPQGYNRSWKGHPTGIWTDDGSQALCLLEFFTEHKEGDNILETWGKKLLQWDDGHLWYDNDSFDSGMQTMDAIQNLRSGQPALTAAPLMQSRNGNGSLMRTLPVALWFAGSPTKEITGWADYISHVTHPHAWSKYSCMFYCLIANHMLTGVRIDAAVELAGREMESDPSLDYGEWSVVFGAQNKEHQGTGFVLDCLWTAEASVRTTYTFEDAVREAITFGNDTDTTACVAGGLAGIQYGYSGIPQRWIDGLKGKEMVEPLAQKLLERHGLS